MSDYRDPDGRIHPYRRRRMTGGETGMRIAFTAWMELCFMRISCRLIV